MTEFEAILNSMPTTTEFKKLRKRITREAKAMIENYAMAERGETWLVCLSGGKDSYTLLHVLLDLRWRGVLPVELIACNLDQGQPGFPKHILPNYLEKLGVRYHIETQDTYSIVTDKVPEHQTYCSLCSRLRRGILYGVARDLGCSSVVLGHHREDILETFFMNLFHGGRLATMPAKLINEDGDLKVLRPLAGCAEADIAKFATAMEFPIIPCNLCGSQDGLQREMVKAMLNEWERAHPGRKQIMFKALGNTRPSHLLDPAIYDFEHLQKITDPELKPEESKVQHMDDEGNGCPAQESLMRDMLAIPQ